ncbi:unnamed protein product [Enterobius vermicularis]|uniref:Carboxylic ester hydrolase n=1 Tax=Enterobius vermicularis TaxID=51028 RepID=A0A0N4VC77_ENTVE|nr:unnamed protein product [Enterobius vermicularis]
MQKRCISCLLLLSCCLISAEELVVTTKYGLVRGFPIQTTEGHRANIFLGIPYASPPVGERRFEKPVELNKWDDVLNATEFAPRCIPHDRSAAEEPYSEDCLYLNIIAPANQSEDGEKKAVMIWIHGGAYCIGSSKLYGYTGITNNFASRDIIVVTIQYRLGPYGFLSDGSSNFPGNYGLWDQQAAIKFVKENIAAFGGNPERITLFGSSAGGASVSAHTLSPHSRDLFFASIEISGSILAPWACGEEVVDDTKHLATALMCPTTGTEGLKNCLRTKTPDQIFEAITKTGTSRYGFNIAKYQPRFDGDFFPQDFESLAETAPKKPTIIGLVEKEAAFFTIEGNLPSIHQLYINSADYETYGENDVVDFIKKFAAPESVFEHKSRLVQKKLEKFYLASNASETRDYKFFLERYTQLASDAMFNIPCILMKQLLVRNDWPVWFYFNVHYNPTSYKRDIPIKGATHLDEYPYLFDITPYKHFDLDDDDRKVQKALLDTFTSLAKFGNPSTEDYHWERITADNPFRQFRFSPHPGMRDTFLENSIKFWENISSEGFDIIKRRCNSCDLTKEEL